MKRREALRIIGIGAGLLPVLDRWTTKAIFAAQGGDSRVSFPRGSVIRTLLNDMPPAALAGGATLFHEHFSIDLPPATPRPADAPPLPPNPTKDQSLMIKEAQAAAKDGVACIVDGGHDDMGRDLQFLKKLTAESGLPIVASGGYYMERTYPAKLKSMSDDEIAEELAQEATANRHGAFGEIGESANASMSDLERKVFRAIGKAHLKTNLPIFTHNAYGTGPNVPREAGLEQLDVLEKVGVKPERIAIGHSCCLDDPGTDIIRRIARRGAYVGFDRVTGGLVPDDKKVTMVLSFLEAGYANRMLLCSDFTGRRSEARPGYGNTLTVFAPKLRKAGVKEDVLRMILYDNPRHFLAFVPKG